MSKEQRTYQCRLHTGEAEEILLSEYAAVYGKAERTLFARLAAGGNLTDLKREFLPRFGITARQFNAVSAGLKGKMASVRERRAGIILESNSRIARAKKVIAKTTDPAKKHQKKRRLAAMESRLLRLTADCDLGRIRLSFGSRRLFRAQFSLTANGFASRDAWRKEWQDSRNSQFFILGSKDETAGCQSSVASVESDGSVTLKLRIPNALSGAGKYLTFAGLRFNHGHDDIVAAIGRNLSHDKDDWQAINYRFIKDVKGWRVFVTAALPSRLLRSRRDIGVIGVDSNADHLAVTETDRFGNPVNCYSVPCVTYGKTAAQRSAIIGDAVKKVMSFVDAKEKPLVVEKLDFAKKKAALENESPKYARMLSSFAYTGVHVLLRARAYDAGIEVREVNPAYTSVIGRYKFQNRYGLSAHNAAALVIGRRSMGCRETLPGQLHGTLPLSARNRGRHVWSKWAIVNRMAQAASAAHRRPGSPRSSPSPVSRSGDKARVATIPSVAGETPACEPSSALFG